MKKGVAIPAGVGERLADWPMIARATPTFHGSPYFSDVMIQMEAEGDEPLTDYAQMRLLFLCEVVSTNGDVGRRELALVRWYDCSKRPERITGCAILRPVSEIVVQSSRDSSSSRRRRREAYAIVPIANILKVVQLIPYFGMEEQSQFLVNRFKF